MYLCGAGYLVLGGETAGPGARAGSVSGGTYLPEAPSAVMGGDDKSVGIDRYSADNICCSPVG